MILKVLISTAVAALLIAAPRALAQPRTVTWLVDPYIEAPSETQTSLSYEYRVTDLKVLEEGTDLVALRLHAGITERFELAPAVSLRQRGVEPLQLHEIGAEARVRILGEHETPLLLVYGAYYNDMGVDRDHHGVAGGVGQLELGRVLFSGDVRASFGIGGERDDACELWIGAAVGYSFFSERELTAGIETFAIVPVLGQRMSDPTFGQSAESMTYYYGPSLSFRKGPLWTSASAVTGYFVSEPASNILLRWNLGVSHR